MVAAQRRGYSAPTVLNATFRVPDDAKPGQTINFILDAALEPKLRPKNMATRSGSILQEAATKLASNTGAAPMPRRSGNNRFPRTTLALEAIVNLVDRGETHSHQPVAGR